jgi:hypothetical protein
MLSWISGRKTFMLNETKRDAIERTLLNRFRQIRPYAPEMSGVVNRYKDGSFGVGNLAFAIYSNGLTQRGRSSKHPYGLVFEDGETLFSIGYFRKELDPEDADGYLFIVAPRGKNISGKTGKLIKAIEGEKAPCKGAYARFLKGDHHQELLASGFLPIEASSWHPQAPMEDETYSHAVVNIAGPAPRKTRLAGKRFNHFLEKNKLRYSLEPLSAMSENRGDAKRVIDAHFEMLQRKGKAVGSMPEDHYNLLSPDLLGLKGVHAWIGYLQEDPVSVFIGELLSPVRFGLYTPFTLRDAGKIPPIADKTGFTAMPTYAYVQLFETLRERGISEVHMGGSELPSLDEFKKKLGAAEDKTYWAFRPF